MRDTIVFGTSDSGTTPPKFTPRQHQGGPPVPGPSDTGRNRLDREKSRAQARQIREGFTEEEKERFFEQRRRAIERVKDSNRNYRRLSKVLTPDPMDEKLSKRQFFNRVMPEWRQNLREQHALGGANEPGASSSSDPYTTPPSTPRRDSDTPATMPPTPEDERKKDEEIDRYIQDQEAKRMSQLNIS